MSLRKLLLMFLKIGATSFGGYMALVAHVQDNVVEKRKWLSREDFLDGVTLAQMLPGATGINVVTYVGQKLRGTAGGIVSVLAVVAPSFLLMVILSELYLRYRYLPQIEVFLAGVNPAVIALLLVVAVRLGRQSVKSLRDTTIALAGLLLTAYFKGNFVLVILVIGLLGMLVYRSDKDILPAAGGEKDAGGNPGKLMSVLPLTALPMTVVFVFSPEALVQLFMLFFKIGGLIFGGGYVMIPFIQKEVVDIHQLVTRREFVDALAIGQATPGPIVITAVFIGYKVAGLTGALAAATGIFMPSAVMVLALGRYLPVLKRFVLVRAFLKGMQAAIVGLLIYVAYSLGETVITDILGFTLLVTGFLLMLWNRVDNVFVILGSGLTGLLVQILAG
ncbi:MAG: chromate efflux transporter [Bacillota bacterium]